MHDWNKNFDDKEILHENMLFMLLIKQLCKFPISLLLLRPVCV